MKIDINKKYQTRDGREVRIYAVDGGRIINDSKSIHGAVKLDDGWCMITWGHDMIPCGKWKNKEDFELIEVKSQKQQLIELLERGEKVLCMVSDNKEFIYWAEKIVCRISNSFFITDDNEEYLHAKPLVQKEVNKYSFEKLINKERDE
jgi:hypothetical protein